MMRPKSRLKGDFFNEKATKKQTKFTQKQTKKVDFFLPKKQTIFNIPIHQLTSFWKLA